MSPYSSRAAHPPKPDSQSVIQPVAEPVIRPSAERHASTGLSQQEVIWLCAIVAIGINLRPLLTSISPLMSTIRSAT
jgi:MFS transporter, CP family, cyanate transporter